MDAAAPAGLGWMCGDAAVLAGQQAEQLTRESAAEGSDSLSSKRWPIDATFPAMYFSIESKVQASRLEPRLLAGRLQRDSSP